MRRMVAMAGDAEITNSGLFALYKGSYATRDEDERNRPTKRTSKRNH